MSEQTVTADPDLERDTRRFVELSDNMRYRLDPAGRELLGKLLEHMSLRQAAREMGCSPAYLSNINCGKQPVSPRSYLRMLEIFRQHSGGK